MGKRQATTPAANSSNGAGSAANAAAAAPGVPGGNVAAMGGDTSYTQQTQDIGAILRGEEPAKRGQAAAGDGQGAGNGAEDGQGAPGEGAGSGQGEGAAGEDEGAAGAEDGQGEGVDQDGEGEQGPVTVPELAKALGVKPGELLDSLQVDVDLIGEDGTKAVQSITLGDLRRGYIAADTLETKMQKFETDSEARSLEFMNTRAALEEMANVFGTSLPKEAAERIMEIRGERLQNEQRLMIAAIPEWKESARFFADRSQMVDHLKPYGFTAADVYAIGDHRIARYVRDNAAKQARSAKAEQQARSKGNGAAKPGQAPAPGRKQSPLRARLANIVNAGKAAKSADGKAAAIGALLRNSGVE